MDKLLDTLTNSCEGLKKKGIITPEEYEKCKSVGDDEHRDEYSANENKNYINKVFGSKSDQISHEENLKYDNYESLFRTNMESLINAQKTGNKQQEFKFTNNLNNIKDEIKELINEYELNIRTTKSHKIYKEMLLKNRKLTKLLNDISIQKNEMLSVKKKHSNIDEKRIVYNNYFKLSGFIFVFLLIVFLYLISSIKEK